MYSAGFPFFQQRVDDRTVFNEKDEDDASQAGAVRRLPQYRLPFEQVLAFSRKAKSGRVSQVVEAIALGLAEPKGSRDILWLACE